jgi:hypothetical protein
MLIKLTSRRDGGFGEGWIREGDLGDIDMGEGGVKELYFLKGQ